LPLDYLRDESECYVYLITGDAKPETLGAKS